MNAEEFISKWRPAINHLGLQTVGIHVGWNIIQLDSKVEAFSGEEAWEKVLKSTPPWFKIPQTFQDLKDSQNSDYQQIAQEEIDNGKIEYYRTNGLQDPYFCAFAKGDGTFLLLGDGNHRLLDCLYLMKAEKRNFDSAIAKTTVDIIYLSNFDEVMRPDLIWKENWK